MPTDYARLLLAEQRTPQGNAHLGWMLAFVAGAINAGGFVAVQQYTSHMTGMVSAAADGLAMGTTRALTDLVSLASRALARALLKKYSGLVQDLWVNHLLSARIAELLAKAALPELAAHMQPLVMFMEIGELVVEATGRTGSGQHRPYAGGTAEGGVDPAHQRGGCIEARRHRRARRERAAVRFQNAIARFQSRFRGRRVGPHLAHAANDRISHR